MIFYNIILHNVEILDKEFFDHYSSMVSEVKLKVTKGIGLKILTRKQMLQRLPIALAQVKAINNSQSLLNEISFFSVSTKTNY